MSPFIVYGLPRSRTNWLSHFLSYGGWKCYHEQAMYFRDVEDIKSWFQQGYTGTAETGAAPGWRLIQHYCPEIKTVVVRRPVEESVEAMLKFNLPGQVLYERDRLVTVLSYVDRMLDQIEEKVPGVLSVRFADLMFEETCAKVFEHCLPFSFDPKWYGIFKDMNLQIDTYALLRYRNAHRAQIDRFKSVCWSELRRLKAVGAIQ